MANPKSMYVCKVCGLGLAWWMGTTFKHIASGSTGKGCGRAAVPMRREQYEAQMRDLREMLKGPRVSFQPKGQP